MTDGTDPLDYVLIEPRKDKFISDKLKKLLKCTLDKELYHRVKHTINDYKGFHQVFDAASTVDEGTVSKTFQLIVREYQMPLYKMDLISQVQYFWRASSTKLALEHEGNTTIKRLQEFFQTYRFEGRGVRSLSSAIDIFLRSCAFGLYSDTDPTEIFIVNIEDLNIILDWAITEPHKISIC